MQMKRLSDRQVIGECQMDFDAGAVMNGSGTEQNGSRSMLSLEQVYRTHTVIFEIEHYAPPIFMGLGIPGNALCAYFWLQRDIRSSSGVYLASMAIAQLCFLVLYAVFYTERNYRKAMSYPVLCEIFIPFFYAAQYLQPFLTAAFTLERWYAVTFPFQAHRFCDVRKATIISTCLTLGALSVGAVQLVFWSFNYQDNLCDVKAALNDPETFEYRFWSVWTWIVEMTCFGLIPIIVLVFNVLVIGTIRRLALSDKRFQPDLSGAQVSGGLRSSGARVATVATATLLSLSFYFICTTLPVALCTSLFFEHPAGDRLAPLERVPSDATWKKHLAYHTSKAIIDVTALSQYSCAFYIYLLTSRMFRLHICKHLRSLFCRASTTRLPRNGLPLCDRDAKVTVERRSFTT